MTVVNGPSAAPSSGTPAPEDQAPASSVAAVDPEVPARADGVLLIGEMKGSGYREPPSLARRGDGQTIQLTALLHLVLEAIDGHRTYDEIAASVSQGFGRTVTGENVRSLVDGQLRPAGLVVGADGAQPEVTKSSPLLALRFKYAVTDPERTRRLTAPFGWLFHPVVVALVLAGLAWTSWWVFFRKGLASATADAFGRPGLLLLVLVVTILSAGFHEFGHAAAARRGGATPGVMGAGIYLVWPAFYTDVTDSYRLGRAGRVLTDLGGLYFNAIVAVAITGLWWATSYDALLLVVATQILQMVRQLTPLVRFDGYHVLADVTGVPDLFHHIRPILVSLLPWRWRSPETSVLKPWARAVVSIWVIVVVPMLLFSMWCMVLALPRLLGTAWASAGAQSTLLGRAWSDADVLEVLGRGLALVAVVFPVLATGIVLFRVVRTLLRRVLAATQGRPARRAVAGVLAVALIAGLVFLWWPQEGRYRPIQAYEGGTLTQAAAAARPRPQGGLRAGSYGRITTGWSDRQPRPTAAHPQLALVLVPRGASTTSAAVPASSTAGAAASPTPWVFPFNQPLRPGKGDNQAMSVNTRDGTAQYDVAFALVWVEDDSPALNKNEAYAFASCTSCAAISVAFQVVLVSGDNHVAVPQNISAAVNYNCVNCLTYALATQLFVTLDGPLKDGSVRALNALWQEIADFGRHLTQVPLSEVRDRLSAYEQKILGIIEQDQGPLGQTPAATPTTGPTEGTTGAPSDGPTDAGTPSPAATPSNGSDPTPAGTDPSPGTDAPTGSSTDAPADPSPTTDPSAAASPEASATP